jgi:hypothetical protein
VDSPVTARPWQGKLQHCWSRATAESLLWPCISHEARGLKGAGMVPWCPVSVLMHSSFRFQQSGIITQAIGKVKMGPVISLEVSRRTPSISNTKSFTVTMAQTLSSLDDVDCPPLCECECDVTCCTAMGSVLCADHPRPYRS